MDLRSIRGTLVRAAAWLVVAFIPGSVLAEGSRTLYPTGYTGSRANLDVQDPAFLYTGIVARRGFLYVYARQGEFILVGSRNRANAGDVFIYDPQSFGTRGNETIPGAANFTCSAAPPAGSFGGGTRGTITTRNAELAGPNSADNTVAVVNGWSPCAYLAPSTGIYGVRFTQATSGAGPDGVIDPPAVSNNTVAAWDVTVRANATTTSDINGRLFTYAYVAFTGGNSRPINTTLYYVTQDGYRYRQTATGLDPNGFAMWANTSGFFDLGQPLYKDIRGAGSAGAPQHTGLTAQLAQFPIFFSNVADTGPNDTEVERVLAALGIAAIPPVPTVSGVTFTGNRPGNTSTVGAGGVFSFTTTNTVSFQIVISRDGVDFDPANPLNREITGLAPTGTYSIYWDGRDNNNTAMPAGTYPYRIVGRNGEVHFPLVDAEGNASGGPQVVKLNGDQSATVYYDDRGYLTNSGQTIGVLNGLLCGATPPTPPTPTHSLLGVNSTAAYRSWPGNGNANTDCNTTAGTGFGDAKSLDLWAFESTPAQTQNVVIIPQTIVIDVATQVTVQPSAQPGQTVNGTVVFRNDGNNASSGTTYTMTLGANRPASMTFTGIPAGITATYNAGTGVVTFTGMPASLASLQQISIPFQYPAPNVGPVVVTSTIAANETAGANTSDNQSSGSTAIIVADVRTSVTVPASAATGTLVTGSFQFANDAAATAAADSVTYTATIGTAGNRPVAVNFTALPAGVTASYDAVSGIVTFTGMPTTLTPGQVLDFTFEYTAPAPGTVPVSTSIATSTAESSTANNTANGTTTITAPAADLSLTKSDGGVDAVPGTNLVYTLSISNAGPSSAASVSVSDTIPAGLGFVSATGAGWTCNFAAGTVTCTRATLAVGAAPAITLTLSVPAGYSGANPISNSATVTTTTNDPIPGNNTGSDTTPVAPQADLSITKNDGGATASAGGTVVYTLVVTNTGPSDAAGVQVQDATPAGLVFGSNAGDCTTPFPCALGTIAAGATRTITTTFNVPAGYAGPNPIANTAAVTSTTPDPNGGNNSGSDTTPVTAAQADLSIVKDDAGASVVPGNSVTYTLAVANSGPADASTVSVTDTIPAGLGFVSANGVGWTCGEAAGVVTCTRPALAVGPAPVIALALSVPAGYAGANPIVNSASVASATNDPTPGNNTDGENTPVLAPSADLSITKDDGGASASAGGSVVYTIVVTNNGPSDAAAVSVADTTPPGLVFQSNAGACTTPFPCALGTVPAGATRTITTTFAVPSGYTAPDPITNTATVSSTTNDPSPGNNSDSDTTPLTAPQADLAITKSDGGAGVTPGNNVTYTLAVTNNGPADAANLTVSDTVPAGLGFVSANGAGWTCGEAAGVVTCTRPALAVGAAPPITLVLSVPGGYTGANPIVNTATVTTTTNDPNPTNNTGTDSTPVGGAMADLAIVKDDGGTTVVPGNNVTYTLAVSNAGPSDATSVSVTDTIPAGLGFVSANGTGWSCGQAAGVVTCTRALLASGASAPAITLVLSVPPSYVAPDPISNAASVTSSVGDPDTSDNTDGDTTPLGPPSADLSIDKDDAGVTATPGANLVYTLAVANAGPSTAANVAVSDAIPAGLTFVSANGSGWTCNEVAGTIGCTRASLAPGAAPAITVTLGVPVSYAGPNPILNTASVTSTTADPNPGNETDNESTPVGSAPPSDMAVALSGFPLSASPNANVTGTITCTNVSANVALTATCGATGLPVGTTVTCVPTSPAATVAPAATIVCSVSFTAPATGLVSFTGTTGASNDSNAANNSAPGQVRVVDAVDDGTTTFASGAGGNVPLLPNDTLGGAAVTVGGTGNVTIALVANGGITGATIDATGRLVVPASTPAGTYTITYRICAVDTATACDTASATVTISTAPPTDMGVALSGFPLSASPSANVTGTITCTNLGQAAALDATCGATGLPAGATVTCTPPTPVATLASGAAITCSVGFTAPTTGLVSFTGTTGASNDSNPANNSAPGLVRVVDAVDDGTTTFATGVGGTVPLLPNDTIGGTPATVGAGGNATITLVANGGISGATIDPQGRLVVPAATPAGTYTITYRICAVDTPAACDTATATIVVQGTAPLPRIGIAKRATAAVANGDGSWSSTITLTVRNLGNEALNAVSITDALATADGGSFGTYAANPSLPGQYGVAGITATGLTANGAYTGAGATREIANGTLAVGASATISFTLRFVPTSFGTFPNQARAAATGTTSGVTANDMSIDGTDPDPNANGNPGDPGEDTPTPIIVTGTLAPTPVPTLSTLALLLLAASVLTIGAARARTRRRTP